jgi:DNA-binding helix-hairpin-helix protein with protein kinase domain
MVATAMHRPARTVTTDAATYMGSRSALAYKLGQEIGAGGNGVVYAVSRRPELVAKIQKNTLSRHDIDKLDVLVRGATPELLSVAAWPTDLLKTTTGRVVGYVMPRILDARPLYELYSPRSRIQHFPCADFRFLVHTAANVARLFAAVHKAGFICGDVNHSNILVRQSGTVAAVDCDSFQVGDGSHFPCLVGTELFIPPELLGASLGATRRTLNHDDFGLAVLIFHLLFMGRHPFAGRFLGRGDMPIERSIAESRFAYSRDATRTQMTPPPYTPPMTAVGPAVTELFERAFHPVAIRGSRPTPKAWIDALDCLKLSLVPCKSVSWHHHLPGAGICPWCAIEGPARVRLFGGIIKVAANTIAGIETLWARYLALVEPGPTRPLPVLPPKPQRAWTWSRPPLSSLPSGAQVFTAARHRVRSFSARIRGKNVLWAACAVCVGAQIYWDEFISLARNSTNAMFHGIETAVSWPWNAMTIAMAATLALFVSPILFYAIRLLAVVLIRVFLKPPPKPTRSPQTKGFLRIRGAARRQAERAWAKAAAAWKAQPAPPDVSDLRPVVEDLRRQFDALGSEREAAIRMCAAAVTEDAQRVRYLGSFRIEDAKLTNIGPARCAVLRSWGIDTAADIDETKIATIPGFGKSLTDKLVIWRAMKEKAFVPSTAAIIDPHDVQRIDRRLAARRTKLVKDLREKITEVERRMGGYVKQREALWAQVEAAYQRRLAYR